MFINFRRTRTHEREDIVWHANVSSENSSSQTAIPLVARIQRIHREDLCPADLNPSRVTKRFKLVRTDLQCQFPRAVEILFYPRNVFQSRASRLLLFSRMKIPPWSGIKSGTEELDNYTTSCVIFQNDQLVCSVYFVPWVIWLAVCSHYPDLG